MMYATVMLHIFARKAYLKAFYSDFKGTMKQIFLELFKENIKTYS